MPRDLFGTAASRPPSVRPYRRTIVLVSLASHIVALSALLVADVFAVGPLPEPRHSLGFDWVPVRVADIELPPPAPRHVIATSTDRAPVSPNAAPVVEPTGITEETGLESVRNQVVTGPATTIEDRGGVAALGPVVAPPPPPPQTPVRLHSGIKAPVKIVDASPEYPGVARQARVTGVVILEATIGVRGDVQAVRVLRSIPLLDRAAVDAVQRWKFTPALLNGVPVPVIVTVTVNFTLR